MAARLVGNNPVCLCVCVCLCVGDVHVCVCVCERERERARVRAYVHTSAREQAIERGMEEVNGTGQRLEGWRGRW